MSGARFTAYASRKPFVLMLALSSLLAAICAWGSFRVPQGDAGGYVLNFGGLSIFAICVLIALRRLLRTAPVLEIDDEGLRWPWKRLVLPWSALDRAEVRQYGQREVLALWLADAGGSGIDRRLRKIVRVNREALACDIVICICNTNRRFDELVEAVAARKQEVRTR